jgi:hypothetical protein
MKMMFPYTRSLYTINTVYINVRGSLVLVLYPHYTLQVQVPDDIGYIVSNISDIGYPKCRDLGFNQMMGFNQVPPALPLGLSRIYTHI